MKRYRIVADAMFRADDLHEALKWLTKYLRSLQIEEMSEGEVAHVMMPETGKIQVFPIDL